MCVFAAVATSPFIESSGRSTPGLDEALCVRSTLAHRSKSWHLHNVPCMQLARITLQLTSVTLQLASVTLQLARVILQLASVTLQLARVTALQILSVQ